MLTMRVEFHLSIHDIASVLGNDLAYTTQEKRLETLKTESPKALMNRVRLTLRDSGERTVEYCDELESDDIAEMVLVLLARFPQWSKS